MLETFLLHQNLSSLGPTNFLKYAIRLAVESGISGTTIVLLLLFPLVAALIAAARHLIGIRAFGIFTPAMLAVAFLALGLTSGVTLFILILLGATLARLLMAKLKIHYLARMSLLIWFLCLLVFVSLFWLRVSIFPILILILLAESFIEVQIGKNLKEAVKMSIETFILSLGSYWVLSWESLQRLVLLQPEIVVLGTAVFNVLVGRFTGMRLLEYRRFKRLLK